MKGIGNDDPKTKPWDQHAPSAQIVVEGPPLFFIATLQYGRRRLDHVEEYAQLDIVQKGAASG